jgi:cytochrome c55X
MTVGAFAAAADVAPDRQKELHNLVIQDCGSCHGSTLKGGLGRPLLPAELAPFPEDVIASVILDGVKGTPMPPWRGLLSDAEALWIARELKKGMTP